MISMGGHAPAVSFEFFDLELIIDPQKAGRAM
jgi:hypothetical protein